MGGDIARSVTSREGSLSLSANIDEEIFGKEISESVNFFFKKHKRVALMTLLQSEENRFLKHLTFFDISLPNITPSAIQLQVSRIPDGFSGQHSPPTIARFFLFLNSSPPHRESSRFSGNKNDCFLFQTQARSFFLTLTKLIVDSVLCF